MGITQGGRGTLAGYRVSLLVLVSSGGGLSAALTLSPLGIAMILLAWRSIQHR